LDLGFEVEGTTVERGAFDSAVHSEDCVDRIEQEIEGHQDKEKGPRIGARVMEQQIRLYGTPW
jgi:hypothetical protein